MINNVYNICTPKADISPRELWEKINALIDTWEVLIIAFGDN
jgi:hypothetical protein